MARTSTLELKNHRSPKSFPRRGEMGCSAWPDNAVQITEIDRAIEPNVAPGFSPGLVHGGLRRHADDPEFWA
jgi:hypothetical protein